MSILKKLLHKCSYQLGGKKVNTTSTFPILPPLPKTTDKPEDYKPETYTKMKPLVKGNIQDVIVPIPNAKPSDGKFWYEKLPNANPNEKPVMQLLPKIYGKSELPVIYGQLMNVKDYDERIARISNTPIKASPKSTTPILGNESDTPKKDVTPSTNASSVSNRKPDIARLEPKSFNGFNTDLNSRVKRIDFQDYMPKDNVAMMQKIDSKRKTNVPLSIEEKIYYNMSEVGEFYPDLIEDDNERNILTQEAIKRGIPIKNNNSLKPATQYKRVKKKDNNVSPRFF
jgi:hypothetical protein